MPGAAARAFRPDGVAVQPGLALAPAEGDAGPLQPRAAGGRMGGAVPGGMARIRGMRRQHIGEGAEAAALQFQRRAGEARRAQRPCHRFQQAQPRLQGEFQRRGPRRQALHPRLQRRAGLRQPPEARRPAIRPHPAGGLGHVASPPENIREKYALAAPRDMV
jgi:hypothetical protein